MKYLLNIIFFLSCVHQALAAFDAVCFDGLDKELMRHGVPSHLLPSARDNITQRTFNTKNFGNWGNELHETVPSYSGIHPFPQDFLTSFLCHLFPRDEDFLLANQVDIDPISKLAPEELGKIIRAIADCPPERRMEDFARILGLNLQAPSIKNISSKVFNRQDTLVGMNRFITTEFSEEDFEETGFFDPNFPLTSFVLHHYPSIFSKIVLRRGELEESTKLPYPDNAVRLLRKRRFVEVLVRALEELGPDVRTIQEALASFFWRRAKSPEDVRNFYGGYTGQNLPLSDDFFKEELFSAADFQELTKTIMKNPSFYFSLSPEERFFLISWTNRMNFLPIPYSTAKLGDFSYADCVETSIRNALMQVVFILKDEKPVFDPSLLLEGSPARAYVEEHSTWELLLSSEGRNRWSEILADKPGSGMDYYKEKKGIKYELKSELKTIINAIRYVLGLPFIDGPFDETRISVSLSEISEALSFSSKRPVQLRLSSDTEFSKGFGEIEFYLDGKESASGRLTVQSNHAAYVVAPDKTMPWIEGALKALTPDRLPDPAELGCLIKPQGNVFNGLPGQYTFVKPDSLGPLFDYIKTLPSQDRLRFYKSIDTREVDIYAILINFILQEDSSNLPYMLGLLQKIGALEDVHAGDKIATTILPLIFEGKIPQEQIIAMINTNNHLLWAYSYKGMSLSDWAIRNNKTQILEHR